VEQQLKARAPSHTIFCPVPEGCALADRDLLAHLHESWRAAAPLGGGEKEEKEEAVMAGKGGGEEGEGEEMEEEEEEGEEEEDWTEEGVDFIPFPTGKGGGAAGGMGSMVGQWFRGPLKPSPLTVTEAEKAGTSPSASSSSASSSIK